MAYEVELVAILVVLLLVFIKNLRKPWKYPPGPPALPIIGSIPFLPTKVLQGFGVSLQDYMADTYGDVSGLYIANVSMVFVSDVEILKALFKSDLMEDRPPISPYHEIRLGTKETGARGLLFSFGQEWKDQRKFSSRKLRELGLGKSSMEGGINGEVCKLIERIKRDHVGKPTSLTLVMNGSIVNSLWVVLAGEELPLDDPKLLTIIEAIDEAIKVNTQPNMFLVRMGDWFVRKFSLDFQSHKKMFDTILDLVQDCIDRHKKNFNPEAECNDFIDEYLKEEDLDEKSLACTLGDLFLAGIETTTTTLIWGFLYLLHHPHVQEKVHLEIDKVLGDNKLATLEDEANLPYTCAVIKEILRHSSIVPKAVPHHTTHSDVHINGMVIPKNSFVWPNLMRIHHDPRYWKDPLVFDPERFYDKENNKCLINSNLIPFGTGKRTCLGQPLAEKELFLFFVGLMKAFKYEVSPENPLPEWGFAAGHKNSFVRCPPKYQMILTPRQTDVQLMNTQII